MAGISQKELMENEATPATSTDQRNEIESPGGVEVLKASMTTIDLEDDEPMCRICHNTSAARRGKKRLIKPCLCNGTLGYVHISCLEKWLTLTDRDTCTICEFTFKTREEMKPVREWMWLPMTLEDVLILVGTIIAQLSLLIQLGTLFWVATQHYHGVCPGDLAVAIGGIIISLPWTMVIVIGLTVNVIMSPYWQTWRKVNKRVKLVFVEPRPKVTSPAAVNVVHVEESEE